MRTGGSRVGSCEITAARSGRSSRPPSVIPHGCLVHLRAHRAVNACAVWAIGVTHPLRDPTRGVVEGCPTAVFAVEDTVLGSASITATSWGRNARSDTEPTDGRGAFPSHLLAARCGALLPG